MRPNWTEKPIYQSTRNHHSLVCVYQTTDIPTCRRTPGPQRDWRTERPQPPNLNVTVFDTEDTETPVDLLLYLVAVESSSYFVVNFGNKRKRGPSLFFSSMQKNGTREKFDRRQNNRASHKVDTESPRLSTLLSDCQKMERCDERITRACCQRDWPTVYDRTHWLDTGSWWAREKKVKRKGKLRAARERHGW